MSDGHLHPLHIEDLRRSGLNESTIELMACRSVLPRDIDKLSEGGLSGVESVLEFPYQSLNGNGPFSRYKLFPPLKTKDGTLRYFQPKDSGCHLYILPPVAEKLTDILQPLFIVEGEKKTAAAVQAGLNAIGIGGVWNWKARGTWKGIEELQLIGFADRHVGMVFDSDTWTRDDLQQAVYALGKYLEFRGAEVFAYLISQPTQDKVGLDDFLLDHSIDDFHQLKKLTLKHRALAQHKTWYESWKDKYDGSDGAKDGLQGKPLLLREIDPYSEAVDGAELLTELCRAIRRYVVADLSDLVAAALWCVQAHAIDAFAIEPFLNFSSPEKGCGKSTSMTVISQLLPRPLLSGSLSPASIFRAIERYKPTFLIDEADTFENLNEELRGLLNASHLRASSQVIRVVGDDHEPRAFSTWCPKAIALIGRLPDTLNDRSIVITMRRRKRGEVCERFSAIDPHPELELLGKKIARWTQDNFELLRQARPVAEGIDLRLYDNWMPLLAVADVAGGPWPRWVRIAASCFVAKEGESTSYKVELLADAAAAIGDDRISSEQLAESLGAMADKPWPTFARGKPITQLHVSRILRAFEIKPTNIRFSGKIAKGYYRDEIVAALTRYVTPDEPLQPLHKNLANEVKELERIFVAGESATELATDGERSATNGDGTVDEDGFDWSAGDQQTELDDASKWAAILKDHAARRAQA